MYETLQKTLAEKKVPFLEKEPMKNHTSFKIGGPADIMAMPKDVESVKAVIEACQENQMPYFILGRGSNLLVSDQGMEGVVIKLSELNQISVAKNNLTAGAGANLATIANVAKSAGLAGFEFASGIPGSFGGALYMNGGAYGGEMARVVISAHVLSLDGSITQIDVNDMNLSYRHSRFMESGEVILDATLSLTPDKEENIKAHMDDYNGRRREKQPLNLPSAGSFFKRPVGHFAGGLIEECGLKGFQIGGAAVSDKHAGFVVNMGEATCQDVLDLMAAVVQVVKEKKAVTLEPEVRLIGRK